MRKLSSDQIISYLKSARTDGQILSYWNQNLESICYTITQADKNHALEVIHLLCLTLNKREKYRAVSTLYSQAYIPITPTLVPSNLLNEVKFELATGLNKSRKHADARKLFDELAADGFDMERAESQWDDTTLSDIYEKSWIRTGLSNLLSRGIPLALVYPLLNYSQIPHLAIIIFALLAHEVLGYFHLDYKIKQYLTGFDLSGLREKIRRRFNKYILIELLISGLFYIMLLIYTELSFVIILSLFGTLAIFRLLIDFKLLPDAIKRLNREKAASSE